MEGCAPEWIWSNLGIARRRLRRTQPRAARNRPRLPPSSATRSDHLTRNLGPTHPPWSALPPPVPAKRASMPGDDGLRLHDDQRLTPPAPESCEHDPVDPIGGRELDAARPSPALQDHDLVAEREELSFQVGATPKEVSDRAEQDDQHAQRRPNLAQSDPKGKCLSIQHKRNFRSASTDGWM